MLVTVLFAIGSGCATSKPTFSKEDRLRTWMELAQAALAENDPTAALQSLAEAEKVDPDHTEILFLRTRAFHMKQDYTRALAEIQKFVEKSPKSSDGQLTMGIIYMELGKSKDALAPLMVAANDPLYERASQAQTNLGILYYRQGDFKESELWFNKAIQEAPATACVAHYYRGHLRLKESKFKDAADSYQRSTKQFCGAFAEGFLALGIVYQHLKDFDQARKTFLEVEKRFPNTKLAEQAMERLRKLP
jgi:tetratricopeptide (TPR) repeat protein